MTSLYSSFLICFQLFGTANAELCGYCVCVCWGGGGGGLIGVLKFILKIKQAHVRDGTLRNQPNKM